MSILHKDMIRMLPARYNWFGCLGKNFCIKIFPGLIPDNVEFKITQRCIALKSLIQRIRYLLLFILKRIRTFSL